MQNAKCKMKVNFRRGENFPIIKILFALAKSYLSFAEGESYRDASRSYLARSAILTRAKRNRKTKEKEYK